MERCRESMLHCWKRSCCPLSASRCHWVLVERSERGRRGGGGSRQCLFSLPSASSAQCKVFLSSAMSGGGDRSGVSCGRSWAYGVSVCLCACVRVCDGMRDPALVSPLDAPSPRLPACRPRVSSTLPHHSPTAPVGQILTSSFRSLVSFSASYPTLAGNLAFQTSCVDRTTRLASQDLLVALLSTSVLRTGEAPKHPSATSLYTIEH